MIGILDSGAGGALAVKLLRELSPYSDLAFLADRKNAPYGVKSNEQIKALASRGISRLRELGADKILIACCTASSVYRELGEEEKKIALPILLPTAAKASELSKNGRIGVLATDATVRNRAFSKAIKRLLPSAAVTEIAASRLVPLVEGGMKDGCVSRGELMLLKELTARFTAEKIDTLVLGCTHFPYISETVSGILPDVNIVSSTYEGARLASEFAERENGKVLYTE